MHYINIGCQCVSSSLLFSIYNTYAGIHHTQLDMNPIYNQLDSNLFVEVTANIKPFIAEDEITKTLVNGYYITYNVTESTACSENNKKIEGEAVQAVYFEDSSKWVYPQTITIKYAKDAPLTYHFKNLLKYDDYFMSDYNYVNVIN